MALPTSRDPHPLPPPLGRLAWFVLGLLAASIALIGLVFPIVPGLPFGILAALCFANVSAGFHARLERVPALRGAMGHWSRARHASFGTQLRTAGSLMLLGLVETIRLTAAALRRATGRG